MGELIKINVYTATGNCSVSTGNRFGGRITVFYNQECFLWLNFFTRSLKIGYFSQHHVDQLDLNVCSVELLLNKFPGTVVWLLVLPKAFVSRFTLPTGFG